MQELQEGVNLRQVLIGLIEDGQLGRAQAFADSLPPLYHSALVQDCADRDHLREAVKFVKHFKITEVGVSAVSCPDLPPYIMLRKFNRVLDMACPELHPVVLTYHVDLTESCKLIQEFPDMEDRYRQQTLTKLLERSQWSLAITHAAKDVNFQVALPVVTTPIGIWPGIRCLCITVAHELPSPQVS